LFVGGIGRYAMRNADLFRNALETDDDGADDSPYDAETPEPCRGCNRADCGEQCAEFREWLTVAWLAVDAASGGDADARP
jgi:hypothetical protein